jgi:hypothetical protein
VSERASDVYAQIKLSNQNIKSQKRIQQQQQHLQ